MTRRQLLKLAQGKLIANDVEWIALDSFRVWTHDKLIDSDGFSGVQLTSFDFKIVPEEK